MDGGVMSKDVVAEARQRIQESYDFDRDNRRDAVSDLAFLAGDQWPENVRRDREQAGRPMLTINRLPQFVRQITNDIRQSELSIKALPTSKEDKALADVFSGIMNQIQYQSSARHVFATACEHQVSCGIGWFRIKNVYADDMAWEQELRIEGIRNPLSVYDDPGAVLPDRSDSKWRAIVEVWPIKSFKAKYPKASLSGVSTPDQGEGADGRYFWETSDTIRIAEYWRKVPVKRKIALTQDGKSIDITDMSTDDLMFLPLSVGPDGNPRIREVDTHKVESFIVNGAEVLEGPFEWPGKHFPIVPVIGAEVPLETKTYRYGAIRFARDPQQLYNYYRTASAETIALQPKVPWLATPNMIGPFKAMWDSAHLTNRPYLLYQPDDNAPGAAPRREAPPAMPAALASEAQIASDDMKATTGIYDSALGARSNETSGIAISRRQVESDTANYHFADNLQLSLEHAGRILLDLIPKIYDNERSIRILGEDGAESFEVINQEVMSVDGVPQKLNDLSAARFDVRVTVGKSYQTRRLETADMLMQLTQSAPDLFPMIGDLLVESLDFPKATEMAKRLRNMVPPQALADPESPQMAPPPDPRQEQMAELEMRDGAARVSKSEADADKARADAVKAAAEAEAMMIDPMSAIPMGGQDGFA